MRSMETFFTSAGLLGVAGYLTAYGMLQLGRLDGNGVIYTVLNVVSASLVLLSTIHQFNLATLLINVSWIVLGLGGILARRRSAPAVAAGVPGTGAVTLPGDQRSLVLLSRRGLVG